MTDLLQAYFKRDLKDAEASALGQLLLDEEQALRFAALAEEAYRATGLPAPSLKRLRLIRLLKKWLGGLTVLGALGTVLWLAGPAPKPVEPEPVTAAQPVPASPAPVAAKPQPRVEPRQPRPEQEPTPAPASAVPRYGHLKIKLFKDKTGTLDLRILDSHRRLVRSLHRGALGPGLQELWWDGRDDAGKYVRPGVYIVEMNDGRSLESREVMLEAR